jgi:hypothetical protein
VQLNFDMFRIADLGARNGCHEVDYEIFGVDMEIVEVELGSGEGVVAEPGCSS